ncbi:unnamed protein product [Amoebophrya sp. A25]|nr:unnamed protein product [Amoebophrya sp. A25]|eukprot:GSA25T00007691001.1
MGFGVFDGLLEFRTRVADIFRGSAIFGRCCKRGQRKSRLSKASDADEVEPPVLQLRRKTSHPNALSRDGTIGIASFSRGTRVSHTADDDQIPVSPSRRSSSINGETGASPDDQNQQKQLSFPILSASSKSSKSSISSTSPLGAGGATASSSMGVANRVRATASGRKSLSSDSERDEGTSAAAQGTASSVVPLRGRQTTASKSLSRSGSRTTMFGRSVTERPALLRRGSFFGTRAKTPIPVQQGGGEERTLSSFFWDVLASTGLDVDTEAGTVSASGDSVNLNEDSNPNAARKKCIAAGSLKSSPGPSSRATTRASPPLSKAQLAAVARSRNLLARREQRQNGKTEKVGSSNSSSETSGSESSEPSDSGIPRRALEIRQSGGIVDEDDIDLYPPPDGSRKSTKKSEATSDEQSIPATEFSTPNSPSARRVSNRYGSEVATSAGLMKNRRTKRDLAVKMGRRSELSSSSSEEERSFLSNSDISSYTYSSGISVVNEHGTRRKYSTRERTVEDTNDKGAERPQSPVRLQISNRITSREFHDVSSASSVSENEDDEVGGSNTTSTPEDDDTAQTHVTISDTVVDGLKTRTCRRGIQPLAPPLNVTGSRVLTGETLAVQHSRQPGADETEPEGEIDSVDAATSSNSGQSNRASSTTATTHSPSNAKRRRLFTDDQDSSSSSMSSGTSETERERRRRVLDVCIVIAKYEWALRYEMNFRPNGVLDLETPLTYKWYFVPKLLSQAPLIDPTLLDSGIEAQQEGAGRAADDSQPRYAHATGVMDPNRIGQPTEIFAYEVDFLDNGCAMQIRLNVIKDKEAVFLIPLRPSPREPFYTENEYADGTVNPKILYLELEKKGFPDDRITHCWVDVDWYFGVPNPLSVKLNMCAGSRVVWCSEERRKQGWKK